MTRSVSSFPVDEAVLDGADDDKLRWTGSALGLIGNFLQWTRYQLPLAMAEVCDLHDVSPVRKATLLQMDAPVE